MTGGPPLVDGFPAVCRDARRGAVVAARRRDPGSRGLPALPWPDRDAAVRRAMAAGTRGEALVFLVPRVRLARLPDPDVGRAPACPARHHGVPPARYGLTSHGPHLASQTGGPRVPRNTGRPGTVRCGCPGGRAVGGRAVGGRPARRPSVRAGRWPEDGRAQPRPPAMPFSEPPRGAGPRRPGRRCAARAAVSRTWRRVRGRSPRWGGGRCVLRRAPASRRGSA